ncbi:Zn(II)2Cys6 transcription factor [Aspergillus mulundensis]|uniref:Putative transcription factor with C2H2 and Zn(2)-Cys(6) DNA binding n=1 Tax=Aspergillus mulundensis TaxID=1810919 RepID=A0A3D8QHD4_9EURO|nr:putative transcription factor with C2H2 and Zn(2)-Cys(6) DNA binding [Aspergillus mulundensis]RDW61131.1 putative transcription factor with C2H2 and Zn(2)-Cys(6) DNA binding [Aspergillus mulundensis]
MVFDRVDSLRRHRLVHRREREDAPRTVRACDRCHASKTRCDGEYPCDVCLRRNLRCTFDRLTKVGTGSGPGLTGGNSYEHSQAKSPPETTNDATTTRGDIARQTAISGPEIQDLLLQHESNLREKGLLGTPPRSPQPQNQGKDLDIDKYVAVYFSHFHYQWPVVHRFSFGGTRTEPQVLVLALAMIGLWVTGEKSARERAESMHEKLLALLENRMDEWKLDREFTNKSWPMSTYQTIVLNIIFAIIRDVNKDIYDRCRILLDAVTATCITGGLFNFSKMHALLEPADSVLYSWTYMEETKRLALTIFKLNHHFNTGILRLSDLRFPLPDSGYLWDAPETKDFYRRFHAQVESGTRPCVDTSPQLICDIVSDVREGRKGLGLLFEADSWLGFVVQQASRL